MQTDDLFISESNETFDVIVVGSGVTGGWAAKEFTEKGFKTLMVERGRKIEHRKDYPTEGKGPWQFPNRTKVPLKEVEDKYRIQQRCYAFNDMTKHFFGNDKDYPYSTPENKDFTWIRSNQLGGKSLTWARQSYRMSEFDFQANKRDGHGIDWPIRYKDLAPWYSYVERFVGIAGGKDNLPQLPDGEHLPPFELNSAEKHVQALFAQHFPDRPMVAGRCAHLTKPTQIHMQQGRIQCQARNECQKGCSFGAYFSTQSSTLPAAAKTGLLKIATDSVVHSLMYSEKDNRITGINVIDAKTKKTREYKAKLVFLCASTLGSTQVLLNTNAKSHPNGFANSSGALGHYLMDHCFHAYAEGTVEGFLDEYHSGRRPTGIYIPNFQYEPSRYRKGYVRGYAMGGGASRGDWRGRSHQDGIGINYKESIIRPGPWRFNLYAQGEMLPRYENMVSLHQTKKDAWGIPQLHIECEWSDNERLMMADAVSEFEKMFTKIGMTDIFTASNPDSAPPGSAIHEVGTVRMGNDPKESVLNGFNQSHDIPNLFVTDGASYCSSATVNPSLTFMALTARAADYAVNEVKNRRI
ncbi:GMC family oxidoreductase [Alteromonas sediminis]|uniref:GMC family oxidoreductase n=1 Tax=Alteromonas sediminis TaxID=2259342 RepID=A0A3N5Y7J7_9ALTE|nr:GMC family oxidoreductase [Alteromonas sediminis]RPJ66779.1 GMC family oxidoreductase [Alteromonas sediminis]